MASQFGGKTELRERMGSDVAEEVLKLETQFPHIAAKLIELWDSPALDHYFEEIMLPQRDGRQGFPPDAASIIMRLAAVHQKLGHSRNAPSDIWSWTTEAELVRSRG